MRIRLLAIACALAVLVPSAPAQAAAEPLGHLPWSSIVENPPGEPEGPEESGEPEPEPTGAQPEPEPPQEPPVRPEPPQPAPEPPSAPVAPGPSVPDAGSGGQSPGPGGGRGDGPGPSQPSAPSGGAGGSPSAPDAPGPDGGPGPAGTAVPSSPGSPSSPGDPGRVGGLFEPGPDERPRESPEPDGPGRADGFRPDVQHPLGGIAGLASAGLAIAGSLLTAARIRRLADGAGPG
ncbi:MAG: hypothetical protein Q4E05_00200 [Pseudoclavibacter sp.]|nr:hypothetical protein [Pseudoclavibacter sp.]